ncbi:WD40-repeat-containing domain protein [Melanogaster broomeanus]|nr:WD40-repeat-containing domain protein [Melanogaster broomeanus]
MGHTDSINSISFCPDSRRLVSGSSDTTLRLWNTDDGLPIGEPWVGRGRRSGCVYSVAVSHAGDKVVAGRQDGRVQVWTMDGRSVAEWKEHTGQVHSVRWSPDDLRVVSGSHDGSFIVWELSSGSFLGPFDRGQGWITCTCFSPDGTKIATGGDAAIRIWDPRTSDLLLGPWKEHDNGVSSLAWARSTRGEMIVSGSEDGTVQLWRSKDGATLHDPLPEHRLSVTSVAIHPNGAMFASGSRDGTVLLWDIATRQPIGEPLQHSSDDNVNSIDFSPDGRLLASCVGGFGSDNSIRIWNLQDFLPESFYAFPQPVSD